MGISCRDLTKEDIEVRVQSAKKNGVILLLYKNARVDMSILDETVGPERWQRSHELIDGHLFCNVGINFPTEQGFDRWVWKQDVGTESNTEAEKGEASDSFKRACFNWGIGRELYTAPFIWISNENCQISSSGERCNCYDRFEVEKIKIDNKRITGLAIYNKTQKKRCFVWQHN